MVSLAVLIQRLLWHSKVFTANCKTNKRDVLPLRRNKIRSRVLESFAITWTCAALFLEIFLTHFIDTDLSDLKSMLHTLKLSNILESPSSPSHYEPLTHSSSFEMSHKIKCLTVYLANDIIDSQENQEKPFCEFARWNSYGKRNPFQERPSFVQWTSRLDDHLENARKCAQIIINIRLTRRWRQRDNDERAWERTPWKAKEPTNARGIRTCDLGEREAVPFGCVFTAEKCLETSLAFSDRFAASAEGTPPPSGGWTTNRVWRSALFYRRVQRKEVALLRTAHCMFTNFRRTGDSRGSDVLW